MARQKDARKQRLLAAFDEANEKKIPWEQRRELIHEKFPSVVKLDWNKALSSDVTLLGSLIRDVMRLEAAEDRVGPRSPVDEDKGREMLARIRSEDHTELPFKEALCMLCSDRSTGKRWSFQQAGRKIGWSKRKAWTLMSGVRQPTVDEMVEAAEAFNKDPSFFHEYRVRFISGVVGRKLDDFPDLSVTFYQKLVDEW